MAKKKKGGSKGKDGDEEVTVDASAADTQPLYITAKEAEEIAKAAVERALSERDAQTGEARKARQYSEGAKSYFDALQPEVLRIIGAALPGLRENEIQPAIDKALQPYLIVLKMLIAVMKSANTGDKTYEAFVAELQRTLGELDFSIVSPELAALTQEMIRRNEDASIIETSVEEEPAVEKPGSAEPEIPGRRKSLVHEAESNEKGDTSPFSYQSKPLPEAVDPRPRDVVEPKYDVVRDREVLEGPLSIRQFNDFVHFLLGTVTHERVVSIVNGDDWEGYRKEPNVLIAAYARYELFMKGRFNNKAIPSH